MLQNHSIPFNHHGLFMLVWSIYWTSMFPFILKIKYTPYSSESSEYDFYCSEVMYHWLQSEQSSCFKEVTHACEFDSVMKLKFQVQSCATVFSEEGTFQMFAPFKSCWKWLRPGLEDRDCTWSLFLPKAFTWWVSEMLENTDLNSWADNVGSWLHFSIVSRVHSQFLEHMWEKNKNKWNVFAEDGYISVPWMH